MPSFLTTFKKAATEKIRQRCVFFVWFWCWLKDHAMAPVPMTDRYWPYRWKLGLGPQYFGEHMAILQDWFQLWNMVGDSHQPHIRGLSTHYKDSLLISRCWFSNIFFFYPEDWGDDPIWRTRIFFSNGWVQPPTRWNCFEIPHIRTDLCWYPIMMYIHICLHLILICFFFFIWENHPISGIRFSLHYVLRCSQKNCSHPASFVG